MIACSLIALVSHLRLGFFVDYHSLCAVVTSVSRLTICMLLSASKSFRRNAQKPFDVPKLWKGKYQI